MKTRPASVSTLLLLSIAASAAAAQISAPSLISALPDVRSISPANAAGVLQYCRKNQLVSSSVADAVLQPLTARPDIVKSKEYSAGQAGRIFTNGKTFSLDQANDYLKSQACDKVLSQALTFK